MGKKGKVRCRLMLAMVGVLTLALLLTVVGPAAAKGYEQTNLVSDIAGLALFTDPNVVNPWGIAFGPTGLLWVANAGTGVSTVYERDGSPTGLVVTIPPPPGVATPSAPTGMVFNPTSDFMVSMDSNSGPARFIFVTEEGTISGWNPTVNPTAAVPKVDNSAAFAGYKGLALAATSGGSFIYAANFYSGMVDMFDGSWAPVRSFTDPALTAQGYAPFGIAKIGEVLFVSFARQDAALRDDVPGPGNGFVDIFDTAGNLVRQFAAHEPLNSPWGMVMAPGNFGAFSGMLLVGNFGDGRINAFDPSSGMALGPLEDQQGQPIEIEGLWGLEFPPPRIAPGWVMLMPKSEPQVPALLYFAAGIDDEAHGLVGTLKATPPRACDVRLEAIVTPAAINLRQPKQATKQIRVRVQSAACDALVEVSLIRWRYQTGGAMDVLNTWSNVAVPANRSIWLTPDFMYTYECADRPDIKWKAVVTRLDGPDSAPQNNVKLKLVHVKGDGRVCP